MRCQKFFTLLCLLGLVTSCSNEKEERSDFGTDPVYGKCDESCNSSDSDDE